VIILVRHGQTAANAGALLQGHSDRPLSDLGRAQADSLASALATSGARRVVSSPLARARTTAAPIAAALGCEVETEPALIELDYGEWDGRALADVSPQDWARWRADPNFAPPGGESLVAVRARVERWLRHELPGDEPLIAVSHVSPIKAAVCTALGVDDAASWRMHLDVASVTRLTRRQGGVVLVSFNETPAAHDGVPHLSDGNRPERST
jgi:probable phosphoglycerate mutase